MDSPMELLIPPNGSLGSTGTYSSSSTCNSGGSLLSRRRHSAAINPEFVQEGWGMLWTEFAESLKVKRGIPAERATSKSPACFQFSGPKPSSVVSVRPPPSASPFAAAPLSAHVLHPACGSPFFAGPHFFETCSPHPCAHPQSTMLPAGKDGQIFFGENFEGPPHFRTPPVSATPPPIDTSYPQFDPMQRVQKSRVYSRKVFIGGVPSGTKSDVLLASFSQFGKATIDWPKKTNEDEVPPNGYAFVVFEKEASITKLLVACKKDTREGSGRIFHSLTMQKGRVHAVEIKVWYMADSTYIGTLDWRKYRRFSVFLGGLSRTCSAASLAGHLQVIGPVAYCTIELDRVNEYPKGAGCVVFLNRESYITAIATHQLAIAFEDGDRKIEMKPFITRDMPCEMCGSQCETRFCTEMMCLAYYCDRCWKSKHNQGPAMLQHVPLRKPRLSSS